MDKKNTAFSILLLLFTLFISSQTTPNDTIFKKDGTKIIKDYKTITTHKGYLVTSTYELSRERIENISDSDLERMAIPLNEVDKIISHFLFEKRRKDLDPKDRVWESETNNHKRNVWIHRRSEVKNVLLPDGSLKLLTLLVEGKCDLYLDYDFDDFEYSNRLYYKYYFKKKNAIRSTLYEGDTEKFITTSFNTKAIGEFIRSKKFDYFNDCQAVTTVLKEKEKLNKNDIVELVKLYNTSCD
ncbi:hypothetical protein [Winogradskyella poriferorum]|uniref:hypothetical protein n=1 Tax=Winogradskyella poriferorum TaxID=307627 RepID=UPI003D656477